MLVADINYLPIISCYLIDLFLGETAVKNCLDCSDTGRLRTGLYYRPAPVNKGLLFGYLILLNQSNGIMVMAETLAGG